MACCNCGKETKNPKFCSKSCSVSYNNRVQPKREKLEVECLYCNKPYPKYGPKMGKKRFCSKECRVKYRDSKTEVSGEIPYKTPIGKRSFLKRKFGNICQICGLRGNSWMGKPITLIVDHIDGKADNNSISNLRLVCPNCDSQLPTFKGRNKGNSSRTYTITQK